jgi:PEP-CTERM motif-containing protein
MRFTNKLLVAAAVFATVALVPAKAHAVTFYFDCQITGPSTCADTSLQGSITLTDGAAGTVNGVVDLNGASIEKVQLVVLNIIDGSLTGDPTQGWSFTGITNLTYASNDVKPDGYARSFDLVLNTPNNQFEPLNFSLTHAGLTASDFLQKDSVNNLLYAAVHIGAFNGTDCSLWEGAKDQTAATGGTPPVVAGDCGGGGGGDGVTVPEPASMMLFGLGALGAAYRARRKLAA